MRQMTICVCGALMAAAAMPLMDPAMVPLASLIAVGAVCWLLVTREII